MKGCSDVPEQEPVVYGVEGVMTQVVGGWLLALDRPFRGAKGDHLVVEDSSPPVETTVLAVVESDDGATRDIIIATIHGLHDPRMLTGRRFVSR